MNSDMTAQYDPIQRVDRQHFPNKQSDALRSLLWRPLVDKAAIEDMGIPIDTTVFLTIGGGIGSFIWINNLMIYGARHAHVMSIGMEREPYGRYRRLCRQSQISDDNRLRSDSGSTPDNIWGYPGYAIREALRDGFSLRPKNTGKHLKQIFGEPILNQVYTPIAGNVYTSMAREAERIGWDSIHRLGRVHAVRKTTNGHYAVFYTLRTDDYFQERCAIAQYVHLAVGYPATRVLPELQRYMQLTGDTYRAVNAYEKHDHVYQQLAQNGGLVVVRGRGIVASRILQRLCEVRKENPDVHILHVHRRAVIDGACYNGKQRPVDSHMEIQPFNFPKSAWGGRYREQFMQADEDERGELLDTWGGTTTADRVDWQDILHTGKREGWYTVMFGRITDICPSDSKANEVYLQIALHTGNTAEVNASFLVDATGLDANWQRSPLLCDLVKTFNLPLNVKKRLTVNDSFEIEAMRLRRSRMYATGAMTMGSKFAPVDSFLGLQYAAQCSVQDLLDNKAPCIKPLTPFRSLAQWSRWLLGAKL
ncbi:MAG: hypothetical protein AAFN11_06625 [Chloroflexota bacterium]